MSTAAAPAPLWTPTAERIERATITRYARWLESERGVAGPRLRRAAAVVGRGPGGLLELDLGLLRGPGLSSPTAPCWAVARCPVRSGFQARGSRSPSTSFAARTRPRSRSTTPRSCVRSPPRPGVSWPQPPRGIASGLRAAGVGPGDRVAAYMPNLPETVAAFLACASIGAIWSSCSPDFGARSVVDRFAQIEPKVLLAVDGYRYNGRDFDRRDTVAGIATEIGGGVEVVTFGYLDGSGWPGGLRAPRLRGARVRAAALRPPAVGALQLGHHRPAQGDRARAGRHPAWSTSRSSACTWTPSPATACSGSPPPAG